MNGQTKQDRAPVTDAIVIAVARLVDDAQGDRRDLSHSDLDFLVSRYELATADPRAQGQTYGKAKRVRAILSWALENAPDRAERFVASLIAMLRGKGGFRSGSSNFIGDEAILDAAEAFRAEGFVLSSDGELRPTSLDTLSGVELTAALESYVRRARRGSEDAALLVGTGKDLLEAASGHIITERFGQYSHQSNFPTLLGQAFVAVGMTTPQTPASPGEAVQCRLHRALYEAGCAVNALRNKQGTGHGRPWLPTVTDSEARAAVQIMGIVAGFLLGAHKSNP
jgi:hypothetical protein